MVGRSGLRGGWIARPVRPGGGRGRSGEARAAPAARGGRAAPAAGAGAGAATNIPPARLHIGPELVIAEDHHHEQFFYDAPTAKRMVTLAGRFRAPLLVCNPSLAVRLRAVNPSSRFALLDRDARFEFVDGFVPFDLLAPAPGAAALAALPRAVGRDYDAVFLDPPFANVTPRELRAAIEACRPRARRPTTVASSPPRTRSCPLSGTTARARPSSSTRSSRGGSSAAAAPAAPNADGRDLCTDARPVRVGRLQRPTDGGPPTEKFTHAYAACHLRRTLWYSSGRSRAAICGATRPFSFGPVGCKSPPKDMS